MVLTWHRDCWATTDSVTCYHHSTIVNLGILSQRCVIFNFKVLNVFNNWDCNYQQLLDEKHGSKSADMMIRLETTVSKVFS